MIETLYLHPDALYEQPYEEHELRTEDFCKKPIFTDNSVTKGTFSLKGNGGVLAEAVNRNVIRLRVSEKSSLFSPSITEQADLIHVDCDYEGIAKEHEGRFTLTTENLYLSYEKNGSFCFCDKDGKVLLNTKDGVAFGATAEYSGESSLCYFELENDEHFFGFGGRIMHPDRTHTTVDMFTEKVGRLSGDYGGTPVPFYMSSKGYGLFFNNPWPHVYFDMGKSHEDKWFLHAPGGNFDLFIIKGDSFGEILKEFTEITGRVSLAKRWNLGFWCSSIRFLEAKDVEGYAKRMHEEGYPVDAFVIDGAWRGGKNFLEAYSASNDYVSGDFDWHPDFGDGKALIDTLREQNMKLVLHLNSRSFRPETYVPAVEKGLLRKQEEEVVPVVLNKESESFYKEMLAPRVDEGITQWWTDHADRISGELRPGIPSRNLFGALWNKTIAELMAEKGVPHHMSLTRGGGIGGQKYSLPWAGDTRFGIDYFQEDIRYMLNGSMAGYSLIGYDLGGFFSLSHYATEEEQAAEVFDIENVCRRICQAIVFTPIARVHSGHGEPKLPWNFPEEARPLFKVCLKQRYAWIPYLYSYAVQSYRTGAPIVRPLVYRHLDDKAVYEIEDELYLGDNLLVAPVVNRDVKERDVYLPKGRWVDIWTKECFDGKTTVIRNTPLFELNGLPIFARGGGALVSATPGLTIKEEIPKEITIEFFGKESEIALWEAERLKNVFRCENGTVYLENNTTEDRIYHVVVYDTDNNMAEIVFEKTFHVKAFQTIAEEM